MKPWERLFFSLSSLVVLATIGVKLHELDMPVARFVRSFDIHTVNRIGDFVALAGKGEVIAGVLLLVWVIGWKLKRDVLKTLSLRALFALLGAAACTQLLKHLIGRPRPRFAHADEIMLGPSLSSGLDAFPSGHTLDAFGVATVVSWYAPALRVPVFLAAGLVGLARIVRGSHFPTDVFAGAVLGVVIGSLAAVGFKRWREEALPGLVRTGVPMAVVLFLLAWVVLHPAPVWSLEINQLGAGVALLLAGAFLRGWVAPSREEKGSSRRTVGSVALILGVAVASGPWWGGLLLLIAMIPMSLGDVRPSVPHPSSGDPSVLYAEMGHRGGAWVREAMPLGLALSAIIVIRTLKGLLPLG